MIGLLLTLPLDADAGQALLPSHDVVAWSADGKSCLLIEHNEQAVIYRLVTAKGSRKIVLSDRRGAARVSRRSCQTRLRALRRSMVRLGFRQVKIRPRACRAARKDLVEARREAAAVWRSVYEDGRRSGMEHGRLRALAFRGRVLLLIDNKIHYRGEERTGKTPLRNVRAAMSRSGHLLLLFGAASTSFEWLEAVLVSPTGKPEDLQPVRQL